MQWKSILQLVLGCTSAVEFQQPLFVALLRALHAQLTLALQPESQPPGQQGADGVMGPMLMEGLMENSFLNPLLSGFCEGLRDFDSIDNDLQVGIHAVEAQQPLTAHIASTCGFGCQSDSACEASLYIWHACKHVEGMSHLVLSFNQLVQPSLRTWCACVQGEISKVIQVLKQHLGWPVSQGTATDSIEDEFATIVVSL